MNHLSHEEQEKILDFYFRCAQQEDIDGGRDLIAANPAAAKLYSNLEETLTDLDHMKYEPCPDNLVDLTIARLKLAASVRKIPSENANDNSQLHQLLEKERQNLTQTISESNYQPQAAEQTLKPNFHHRMGELLATAAAIILIFSVLFPVGGAMRNVNRKIVCQNNLRQVSAAFSTFANDHNNEIAESRVQAGDPWWKVGSQNPDQAHSNTRYPWQLVKQGYVKGKVFVCKGNVGANCVDGDPAKLSAFYDFPCRSNISYSFMLFCDKNADALQQRRKVIAGDLNPHFQKICTSQKDYQSRNEFEKILLNEQLKQMMSTSHGDKGQNILYCDGAVEWREVRVIAQNSETDDIFTIQGVNEYTGKEMPTNENDTFLAP